MQQFSIISAFILSLIISIASFLGLFSRAAIFAGYNGELNNISEGPLLEDQEFRLKYSQLLNETAQITKEDCKNHFFITILGLSSFVLILYYCTPVRNIRATVKIIFSRGIYDEI